MKVVATLFVLYLVTYTQAIPTIDEIDYDKYLGSWYQVYASPAVYLTFERNGTCATANYELSNDTETCPGISVYNTMNLYEPGGVFDDILGCGVLTNITGVLEVSFPDTEGGEGEYWIMQLGPEEWGDDERYVYSVISEPNMLFTFVITRDVYYFFENYNETVWNFLQDEGFNTPTTEVIQTLHTDECIYPYF